MNGLTRVSTPETATTETSAMTSTAKMSTDKTSAPKTSPTSTPAKKGPGRRRAVRSGRPPKELAGEVDARVLDAARKIFLGRGFEGASIDEIAQVARSGKQTIYARFRNKRELFTAVLMRDVSSSILQFGNAEPSGASIEERLVSAAMFMLHTSLEPERIGLMRLAIAETHRFPDLASTVGRTAWRLSTEVGARLLGEMTQSDELGRLTAFAPEHIETTARLFLNLVVVPLLMRALFEKDIEVLRAEIGTHVAQSIAFFLAACRNGGVS
jgi:AcrR family transcriptional regulator